MHWAAATEFFHMSIKDNVMTVVNFPSQISISNEIFFPAYFTFRKCCPDSCYSSAVMENKLRHTTPDLALTQTQ